MAKSSYKLSRELVGHTGDVRGLDVGADGSIVSASRDKTAILWKFQDGNYVGNVVMTGHGNFVSTVCVINPNERHKNGLIVTGSNDSHMFIYNPGETEPVHKIKGHQNTVCCLKASNADKNCFLSSSWDISAKLWSLNSLERPQVTYLGHSAAVWSVADLPSGHVVTGSADKTVIVYLRDGTVLHKLQGHTDCVRDIATVNENEFLTCANDAIIKLWSAATGECLGDYYGHTNYIYSISAVLSGQLLLVASSGEDKTVRIWSNGEIDQTIELPAQSIWCVGILPNQDLVCGASDGLVRIFTADPQRYADPDTLQRYEESVANSTADGALGDVKMDNLPDSSALTQPGKKDGETKLVKDDDGTVKAYSWSQKELKWSLIGDVMGANSSDSNKQLYNGIEYDYVFSVDIQDGVPPLKLPYNSGQDPWVVAQKFIDDNQLSQMFLEQVANFIVKNSTPAPVINTSSQFYDPFTGGNRYIPGSDSRPTSQQPAAHPTPPVQQQQQQQQSVNTDDTSSYMPMMTFLRLEQANLTAIHEKLGEFNSKQDAGALNKDKVEMVVKLAGNQNQQAIDAGAIDTLTFLLQWTDSVVFPVLDIARLAVLQKNVNDKLCTEDFLNLLRRHLKNDAVVANQMLTFRLLANMFCHEKGEKLGLEHKDELVNAILGLSTFGNKNNQVAIATFILNLSVALNKTHDFAGKTWLSNVICKLLEVFKEIEAVFRILVALGTLLTASSTTTQERNQLSEIVRQSEGTVSVLTAVACSTEPGVQSKVASVSRKIIELVV